MSIIDFHCDTIDRLYINNGIGLKKNDFHIDVDKLKKGNALAQFFAVFLHLKEIQDKGRTPLEVALEMIDLFYKELKDNSDELAFAATINDINNNKNINKISAFLTIEEGAVLEGSIDNLNKLYQLGVRLITLTWNFPNEIAFPNCRKEFTDRGLTTFGIEVVEEMNSLGMLIDVSHLSDGGFYDVARLSKKPFIASHSNARAKTDNKRNLTDDMIRLLAEKGGVMGINFCANFLGPDNISRVDDMIRHIKHIHNVGGIDVIALGSDFDGIDSQLEIVDYGQMQLLLNALEKGGFKEGEIEQICSLNGLRIIKEVLK